MRISWSSRQSSVCWRSWTDRSCAYGTVLRTLSICSSAQQIPWEFRRQTITAPCLPETISRISNTCAGNVGVFHLHKLQVDVIVMKYGDTVYSVDVLIKVLIVSKFSSYNAHDCMDIILFMWPPKISQLLPLLHRSFCAELDIYQSEQIWNRSCTEKWNTHLCLMYFLTCECVSVIVCCTNFLTCFIQVL